MKYRYNFGVDISQFGFGAMRLPTLGSPADIDRELTEKLLLEAYNNGVNYFDTAYVYHFEQSEVVLGEVFDKHNIRNRVYLATKLPTTSRHADKPFTTAFGEQLSRLRTNYIDFYLIHSLNSKKWASLKDRGVVDFMNSIRNDGVIKHLGFSFHGEFEEFQEIIEDYDWEFCQIQYNWIDIDYQAGERGIQLASSMGIPVIVMEPLRGGMIPALSDPIIGELKKKHGLEGSSLASLSLEFVLDNPHVMTVLSGVNRKDHLDENISVASAIQPESLGSNKRAFLGELREYLLNKPTVQCTACNYCIDGCPSQINIPAVFECYNEYLTYGEAAKSGAARYVRMITANSEECSGCESCVGVCTQSLDIPNLLENAKSDLAV
ncbi:MAG: aldo/keto reductase [Eubacteriaceae bacterium]|nr:aldo/keto reductase [Eubacteriaceae bacterium]